METEKEKKRLLIATGNQDKFREIKGLLEGINYTIISLKDYADIPRSIEDGKTIEENAIKKCCSVSRYIRDMLILADDSGLEVDYLSGRPGVYSARFSGGEGYRDNNLFLLNLLRGVPEEKRGACFRCVIAMAKQGRLIHTFAGICYGKIAFEMRGRGGFGYDCVFIPQGFRQTFAELSPRIKSKISHRANALRKARGFLVQG